MEDSLIMRFLLIFFSLFLLTSCYQTESVLTDSLIYCPDKAPVTLNPQISNDIATLDATTHQLFNRLVKIDPVTQRFVGDIATHWQINDDKTSYTFFLRDDINFHSTDYFTPTRQLNADDVVFSFMRMISEKHPYHSVNADSASYLYHHPFSNVVRDVVKVDEHTIRFALNKPDATLLANLAAHYAVIHSQEYALQLLQEGKPEKIDFYPIGTGYYQFKTNNDNNNRILRFQAHTHPWETPVNINNLILDITPNSTKRYAKLLSGECDVISTPASSQIKQISKNKNVTLSSFPTGNVSYIAFNSKETPFNNVAIRHALSSAINLESILHAVFFDTAVTAQTLLPEQSWAYNPRTHRHFYDPIKSLKELTLNQFNFDRTLRILAPQKSSIFNPNFFKTAELIQANWASIGVKSEIVLLNDLALQSALLEGSYDIYLTGKSPYIKDPDNLFRPLLSCDADQLDGNTSQWCDGKVQGLLDDTLLEVNFIQRIKNYYQLQELIQAQRIYLPIAHLLRFDVFNKNISGVEVDPLTGINFHSVIKVAPIKQEKTK